MHSQKKQENVRVIGDSNDCFEETKDIQININIYDEGHETPRDPGRDQPGGGDTGGSGGGDTGGGSSGGSGGGDTGGGSSGGSGGGDTGGGSGGGDTGGGSGGGDGGFTGVSITINIFKS
ncbi:hypothetical protein [Bacillus cereus]